MAIVRRKLPTLPPSGTWTPRRLKVKEIIWNMCLRCWNFDPLSRVDMASIIADLEDPYLQGAIITFDPTVTEV